MRRRTVFVVLAAGFLSLLLSGCATLHPLQEVLPTTATADYSMDYLVIYSGNNLPATVEEAQSV